MERTSLSDAYWWFDMLRLVDEDWWYEELRLCKPLDFRRFAYYPVRDFMESFYGTFLTKLSLPFARVMARCHSVFWSDVAAYYMLQSLFCIANRQPCHEVWAREWFGHFCTVHEQLTDAEEKIMCNRLALLCVFSGGMNVRDLSVDQRNFWNTSFVAIVFSRRFQLSADHARTPFGQLIAIAGANSLLPDDLRRCILEKAVSCL